MKTLYMALAILGAIVPTAFRVMFFRAHGPDLALIRQTVMASPVSLFLASGILLTGLTVLALSVEGIKRGIKHMWSPIAGLLLFGPAFGLPMYLFLAGTDQR